MTSAARFFACASLVATACHSGHDPATRAAEAALKVPHATGPIAIDGELDEPDWRGAARTGPFKLHGEEMRPYSDARLLWDDTHLYLALYAADQDLRASVKEHDGPVWLDDAFALRVSPPRATASEEGSLYQLDISTAGVVADARLDADGRRDGAWESGVEVAIDRDGTPNDARDEDEEWLIEARLPLSAIGAAPGARLGIALHRCDTPKGDARICGAWGEGPGAAPTASIVLTREPPRALPTPVRSGVSP